jgi:hypothetical protein
MALLALASFLGAPASIAQEPARVALLIGNQGYKREVGPLRNPHNDIALVGVAIAKQGFTTLPQVEGAERSTLLAAVVRDLMRARCGGLGWPRISASSADFLFAPSEATHTSPTVAHPVRPCARAIGRHLCPGCA